MVVGVGSSGVLGRALELGRGGTAGTDDLAGRGGTEGAELLMVAEVMFILFYFARWVGGRENFILIPEAKKEKRGLGGF